MTKEQAITLNQEGAALVLHTEAQREARMLPGIDIRELSGLLYSAAKTGTGVWDTTGVTTAPHGHYTAV
jgi:hypothetical protein